VAGLQGYRLTGLQAARADWIAMALLFAAMLYAAWKPMWDWDVIAYLALAKAWSVSNWGDIHVWVYGLVDQLPNRIDLLNRDVYRAAVATDPEALRQNVGFYQARIGYTGLLAGLMGLGVPALLAVQGLSLLGQALLGTVMWRWMKTAHWPAWGALLVYAFLLFNPTVMKLARWSSPDGLVAALLVLGLFLLLRHNRGWMVAWAVAVLFKPNVVLFLAPVGLWALAYRREAALPLVGLAGLASLILFFFPNFPMAVLWEHGFGTPFAHPATAAEAYRAGTISAAWGAPGYKWVILEARVLGLHGRDLVVWAIMAASVAACWALRDRRVAWLASALFVGACGQIVLFPAFWERYFAGIAVCVLLLAMAGNPISPLKLSPTFAIQHKPTKPNRSTRHRSL
jgi:hypothetical protein